MQLQQFVNETFHHLAKQGRAATNGRRMISGNPMCLYRGPGGTKCAIGFWIDDAHYNPSLERQSAGSPIVQEALPDALKKIGHIVLNAMQRLHDTEQNWESPAALFDAMQQLAAQFNVALDAGLEAEIWANWKNAPPGDLREVNTYRPELVTMYDHSPITDFSFYDPVAKKHYAF